MTAPEVITFGCRLNAFESEVMRRTAARPGAADTVILNTCAVTAEAERQARQAIRRVRRDRPGARIVVTGCAAQIHPQRFADMPEVDLVLGNAEKLEPESYGTPGAVAVHDIAEARQAKAHRIERLEGRVRAFLAVQNGCDHRCTFCIIPYGRGPSRSLPAAEVVAGVRALAENGVAEVVLTGVDVTAYAGGLGGETLGTLVRRVLREVPQLRRLRLTSLDPAEVDEALWVAIAGEERLMPHLHLSLQAGDDLILKRMKRRHGRADAVALCARARALRPDVALGADLIAGFPTETGAQFERTLTLVDDCGLSFLHVFPYSSREGTPAARMPQVPAAIRRERARQLRAKGAGALSAHLVSRVGGDARVLIETVTAEGAEGRAEDYTPVRLPPGPRAGAVIAARIAAAEPGRLVGLPAA